MLQGEGDRKLSRHRAMDGHQKRGNARLLPGRHATRRHRAGREMCSCRRSRAPEWRADGRSPLGKGMSGSPAFSGAIHTGLVALPAFRPERPRRTLRAGPPSDAGFFQGEGVIGPWNDDERAVGNLKTQGLVQRARGEEVEFAVQDHRRNADRRQAAASAVRSRGRIPSGSAGRRRRWSASPAA